MASDQVEVYQITNSEPANDKENVILRAIAGDPGRYKPLAQHGPPTSALDQASIPASMYTLETRYQPIPSKVLPNSKEPRVYYIESKREEQALVQNAGMTKEETSTPTEEGPVQMIVLEPKVVSQPVLYSIVGSKSLPPQIAGQAQHSPAKINPPTVNMPPPAAETSPVLYSLVASPRLKVRIQEPVKDAAEVPSQAPPNLYTVVGNPRIQPPIADAVTTAPPTSILKQTSPVLYSIVANPKLTSNIAHTNTSDPTPATQPTKRSTAQPVPVLYTVVGQAQTPNNISTANRAPLAPIKRQLNDTMGTDSIAPQPTKTSRKIQPLPPISTPLLFSIVGRPHLSSEKKSPAQKKIVPKSIVSNRRISRSLDRQTAPEPFIERVTDIPPVKHRGYRKAQEPTIPKSETIFYPLSDHERSPRSKKPRTTPRRLSPGQIHHRPFQVPNHDPLQLPDYISPYTYHPVKPYREQTVHPTSFPIIKNRYSYKTHIPMYESSYNRGQQKLPHEAWKAHSSERYPSKSTEYPRVWDYQYDGQTDEDDDDDDDDPDGSDSDRKHKHYRRRRPRTPWVPVW